MKKIWLYIVLLLCFSSAISQSKSIDFSHERKIYRSKAGKVPKNVIKDTEKFISSATKANRNNLSSVGRGLQKHSSRSGAFKNIKFSHKDANQVGEKVLRDILNSRNRKIVPEPNNTKTIYDLITGRGVNVSRDGVFNGFRDYPNNLK